MRTILSIILLSLMVSCNTINNTQPKEPIAREVKESEILQAYCQRYLNKQHPSDMTEKEYNYYLDIFCETDEWFELYDMLAYDVY